MNVLQNKTIIIDQYRNFKQVLFHNKNVSSKVRNGNNLKCETRSVASTTQGKAMAQSLRSCVWNFFEIVEGDNSKALKLCKVCQEEGACVVISQGGKQSKQFTTTNLRNHLRKHPKKFLKLTANDKGQRTDRDEYWRLCVQHYCFLNKQITQ